MRSGVGMFFRFAAALMLVVTVSMAQIGLEKQSLRLRRQVSRQYYQMDELLELHAQLRLDIQKLSAPAQYVMRTETNGASVSDRRVERLGIPLQTNHLPPGSGRLPLLRWDRPVRPDGAQR